MSRISDVELKEMAKLQGWPHDMAQELITAREHIPAINAECKRLHEENLHLKSTLRSYVDMQIRMIDEARAVKAELRRLATLLDKETLNG